MLTKQQIEKIKTLQMTNNKLQQLNNRAFNKAKQIQQELPKARAYIWTTLDTLWQRACRA